MGSSPGAAYPVSISLPVAESVMPVYRQLCLGLLSQLLTHEFNNSLTSLSGYAQMAFSLRREEIYLKSAQVFLDVSNRLQELIQHIHTLSRQPLNEMLPCDPNQAALLVQKIMDHHLQKRNIQLQISSHLAHIVHGNLAVLSLGMLTYILDARDRILQEGRPGAIQLRLEEDGDAARIRMSDSSALPCRLADPAAEAGLVLAPDAEPRQALAPLALRAVAEIHSGSLNILSSGDRVELSIRIPRQPLPQTPNP
jgi:C4-dicarboxylate-specific signal transduction histidine kinase